MPFKNKENKLAYERTRKQRTRIEVLQHYGGKCKCCGEWRYSFLAFDHIENGRTNPASKDGTGDLASYIRAQGYPSTFQILCHNCNTSKSILGICVHEQENLDVS